MLLNHCVSICLSFILLVTTVFSSQAQTLDNLNVYVWRFTTPESQENELTKQLTREFEELFVNKRCVHKVLDRHSLDRILAHLENEKLILSINNLSSESLDNLRMTEANAVIFGEVYDDVHGGQIRVAVSVQALNGDKLAIVSTRFLRTRSDEPESRERAMQELAQKLCNLDQALHVQNNTEISEQNRPFVLVEDFESGRRVKWWSPDSEVFKYNETVRRAYNGNLSFRVLYDKTDTYQFIGAELPPGLCDFTMAKELNVWVYGQVELLLKLEDRNLKQADVSVQHTTTQNDWTLISFDYTHLHEQINLKDIKSIFLFPAPGEPLAKGEFFLDDIILSP